MKDGIIKGTGDSRYLKSGIPANITFEQFVAMLRGGTLPIDFAGINAAGWQQLPTWLNKMNLLTDGTAAALGLTGDPTVDMALALMANSVHFDASFPPKATNILGNELGGFTQLQTGAYVGTGTYGVSNKNTLAFDFTPKLVIVRLSSHYYFPFGFTAIAGAPAVSADGNGGATTGSFSQAMITLEWGSNSLTWYQTWAADYQMNRPAFAYSYIALG